MDIKSADELLQVLMVLKDAGVTRARLGDVEVEFARAEPDAPPEFTAVDARVAASAVDAAPVQHPGYHALFGGNPPTFKAAS